MLPTQISTHNLVPRLLDSWRDFDDTYLALQQLWMVGATERTRLREDMEIASFKRLTNARTSRDRVQYLKADFLLDLDLGDDSKSSLISEHGVMSLIGFRRSFERFSDFQSQIAYIDLGCVLLSFFVEVPEASSVAEILGIETNEVGKFLLDEKLESSRWKRISESYRLTASSVELFRK